MLLGYVGTHIAIYAAYYLRRRKFSTSLSLLQGDTSQKYSATNSPRSKPEGSQNHGTSRIGRATADTHFEVRFQRLVSLLTTCCYLRRSMKIMLFHASIERFLNALSAVYFIGSYIHFLPTFGNCQFRARYKAGKHVAGNTRLSCLLVTAHNKVG